MKKILCLVVLFAALPAFLNAQVEKRVEVTKAYVPSVESAVKLPAVPDMVDTVKLRPEIDYVITPLSLTRGFETRPIKPAKVTYWEFNRPRPFYLKAGAGYPLNSVFDFYASSQNPGTGYVLGYVNHEGRYADIENCFGAKNNSVRLLNRVGAAAGKYFGRHTLEGDMSYENRLYHRYGAAGTYVDENYAEKTAAPGSPHYGDADFKLRFGDDFKDLGRLNFDLAVHANLFWDHSDFPGYTNPARQTGIGVQAKLARRFGRHTLRLQGGFERLSGQKAIDGYSQNLFNAGLRYGFAGDVIDFEAGADYYGDRIHDAESENYVIPYARLRFDLGTKVLQPFAEVDGGVYENSYRSLTRQNPYVYNPLSVAKSSVDYNFRFGVDGSLWRERLIYRLYAGFSIRDNHLYWTCLPADASGPDAVALGYFIPVAGRQTVTSFNGEAEFRPVGCFRLILGVHGFIYNDEGVWRGRDRKINLDNGLPSFVGSVRAQYDGRKVSVAVAAEMQSERSWTIRSWNGNMQEYVPSSFEAPFGVDLRVTLDWHLSGKVTLFAEGRNLADRRLYRYAFYPEYGANCTVGVKLDF